MGVSNLKLVKPKNKAKTIQTFGDIQEFLTDTYKDIPDKSQLKYLVSFILFVCCLVEEAYAKNTPENKKISKKDEVFNHIEHLSIGQINQVPVGKLVTRVVNDTNTISEMYTNVAVNLIKNVLEKLIIN